ncbi:MAG: ABC transporter permease, partial [Pseudoalteromonas marina]
NVALAIKDIIKGTVDYTFVGLIFLATALIAGALLAFCVKWFNREDVLFR